ncbi:hypothetical protein [Lapillicoccus jejuensis]|uniref:DUF4345 domain-containing protein n=1 Tax=Lapillicoccus jejuensis TaxID=402171 RepID=A0A542E005_9MICO|nr:hypothetical protein [Lapillicoccus jejuensis]TQJ08665.1 hypothetical protein FB458_1756 [Lapillicoccus jejuensis]
MTETRYAPTPSTTAAPSLALGVPAALLSLGVAAIHVVDQGGVPGSKDPSYVGIGYWVLEVVAVVLAVALFTRRARASVLTWVVAAGVGLGPLLGYCLSRGPGLPGYTDDMGNWTEPLGIISLVVEGLLILVALAGARAARPTAAV